MAALVAIVYPELKNLLSIVGGFACSTIMFGVPMAITFVLVFGQCRMQGPLDSPQQIGTFWGVTKLGTILAALATLVCIILGYTSAMLALIDMVKTIWYL